MAQPFRFKRTLTAGHLPSSLAEGELALGLADDPPKLWVGVPTSIDPSGLKELLIPETTELVFDVRKSVTQSVGASWTPFAFDSVPTLNTHGVWNGTNMTYTPTVPGYYCFEAYVPLAGYFRIYRNGFVFGEELAESVGVAGQMSCTGIGYMNGSTDFIQPWVYNLVGVTSPVMRLTAYRLPSRRT